jgi:hypothetical protein
MTIPILFRYAPITYLAIVWQKIAFPADKNLAFRGGGPYDAEMFLRSV